MTILAFYNIDHVLEEQPSLIGSISGVNFYECPRRGDETYLIAIHNGVCGLTNHWDLDDMLADESLALEVKTALQNKAK